MTKKIPRTTSQQKVLVLSFFVAAALLLAGVLVLAMGRSSIQFTWTPQAVEATTTATFAAKPNAEELPARFVQTSLDVTKEFTPETDPTPAATPVFTGKARGQVTITNNWSQTQPLQAGTRVRSADGKIFRTQARVDVPVGGSVTTLVIADVAGEDGAKPKGTTFILPGLWSGLQEKITAVAASDFTGENSEPALPGLTQTELANAQAELLTTAAADALPALQKLAPEGFTLYADMVATTVTKRVGPAAGDPAKAYTLKLTVKATGIAVDTQALTAAAKLALGAAVSSDLELQNVNPTTFTYKVDTVDTKAERATVTVKVKGTSKPSATHPLLTPATYLGKSIADIQTLLQKESAVGNITIDVTPFWAKNIPNDAGKLELKVE